MAVTFPALVYKGGGPYLAPGGYYDYKQVADQTAYDAALSAGWKASLSEVVTNPYGLLPDPTKTPPGTILSQDGVEYICDGVNWDAVSIKDYTASDLPDPATLGPWVPVNVGGVRIESTGGYWRRTAMPGKPHLVSARNFKYESLTSPSALTRGYLIYKPITTDRPINGLHLVFTNWIVAQNGVETDNTSSVTIKVGLQIEGSTTVIPVFFGGKRTYVMTPGETLMSDKIFANIDPELIPGVYLRIWVSVPTLSDKLCLSNHTTKAESTNSKTYRIDSATNSFADDAAYSSAGAVYNVPEFGPTAVLGYAADGSQIPSVAIIGSSSAAGQGDDQNNANSTEYVLGYLARSLKAKNIPYINIASAGETLAGFLGDTGAKRRQLLSLCNCLFGVNQYGANDISAGTTYAQMQVLLERMRQLILGMGATPYFSTYTPYTSSTDSWATVENQTVINAIRPQLSAWMRDVSGYKLVDVEIYSDSALAAGGTVASGKWRVDLGKPTSDGQHCDPLMHHALQNAINTELDAWADIKF